MIDNVRYSGPVFVLMTFIAGLAASLWMMRPELEVLLAGPLVALVLYQRYAYRSVVATRDAETDALTGLGNHRGFHTDLHAALELAATTRTPVTLALIDLDNFKSINDRFGHPGRRPGAGDRRRACCGACWGARPPTGSAARSSR